MSNKTLLGTNLRFAPFTPERGVRPTYRRLSLVLIIETVSIDEIREKIRSIIYKLFKPKIFKALEEGDDAKVIKLATSKRLRSSKGFYGESQQNGVGVNKA